jgi:hypothetical protein
MGSSRHTNSGIRATPPRLAEQNIPRAYRPRLDTNILKRVCRLREKQALDALAENVVVLAGKLRQLSQLESHSISERGARYGDNCNRCRFVNSRYWPPTDRPYLYSHN